MATALASSRDVTLTVCYDIYVDGSCDHGHAIGAAAEISPVGAAVEVCRRVLGRRGYFVGPGAGEVLSILLGYRTYRFFLSSLSEDVRQALKFTMHTDSSHALLYLNGFTPTDPAGTKLLPLIALLREERRRHPELEVRKCSSTENRADRSAWKAMRAARDGRDNFASTEWMQFDDVLLAALNEVEARTKIVH